MRATLEFADGKVKSFKFQADTLKVHLGSFLTLTATGFTIDTGATGDEEMASFQSVGAEVTIGGLTIGGEARNFAFTRNGNFVTQPGFGVFLTLGGADGKSFKWPSWLPIHINSIGITWPDINADPGNFLLTLSASVTGIQGHGRHGVLGLDRRHPDRHRQAARRRVPDHRHRLDRRPGEGQDVRRRARRGADRRHPQDRRQRAT